MKHFDSLDDLKVWAGRSCVVVYGSYGAQIGSPEYEYAVDVGRQFGQRDCVVCTGGYAGIMEGVLKGAFGAGGKTIGILTRYFDFIELRPNPWVKAAFTVDGLVDRMHALFRIGDIFVVFPGSTGTLAELSLTLELVNKDPAQRKPIVCLGDHWKPVLKVVGDELRPFHPHERVNDLVRFADSAEEIFASLRQF